MTKTNKIQVPAYLKTVYSWLYLNPKVYNFFDNSILLNVLTLGYHSRLAEEVKKELSAQSNVLQVGVTLGSQTEKAYSVAGMLGEYTIVDVVQKMLVNYEEKHLEQRIKYVCANVAKSIKGEYDTIICYMLLHELPPVTRAKVLENIINALKPGGKVIFIDYHMPSSYNPLKYFIRAINRLYQPFAESIWKDAIKTLTPNGDLCSWSKQTYFGGVYQKVVATKRP